jgi:hypothetical protein
VSALCILAGGVLAAQVAASAFTLAWTHSIEKIPWQEDWRVEPAGLRLVAARVQGTGAGMEPPPESRLVDGWWRWEPHGPALPEVVLRRSGATADWRICVAGSCRPMSELLPPEADPVVLRPCEPVSP